METFGLDRRVAVRTLLSERGDGLLVTGLGSSTWDAAAAGDTPRNFYLWGGMGGAAAMGLGLAQAQPDLPVMVLTGDGEMLMGLGSLATIGRKGPRNLSIVVLDNGHYGETGMQRSATSVGAGGAATDLAAVARACGFTDSATISDPESLTAEAGGLFALTGLKFRTVRIRTQDPHRVLPERDAVILKSRFRAAIG